MSGTAKKRRYRIIGTLYLILALILVFQVELLAANWYDFQSAREMLNSLLLTGSRFQLGVAVIFGPLLHNTAIHLVENLVVLILAAVYVEYKLGSVRLLYTLYIITGWGGLFGACIVAAPAVGASASVNGLTAFALMVSFSHSGYYIISGTSNRDQVYSLALNILAFFWFLIYIKRTVIEFDIQNGTSMSHAAGALIGLLIGMYFLWSKYQTA